MPKLSNQQSNFQKTLVASTALTLIGIDPGKSGGISIITTIQREIVEVVTFAMPETERDTWEVLEKVSHSRIFAAIEKVHAMPEQGVSSSFTFGQGYGFLRGCLIASKIPFEEVTPQRWQKILGIIPRKKAEGETKVQFKNRLKAKCQQLFPHVKINLKTCDALLISEYLRRTLHERNQ